MPWSPARSKLGTPAVIVPKSEQVVSANVPATVNCTLACHARPLEPIARICFSTPVRLTPYVSPS
eukprot:5407251-Prorocentrum_lima.AAC.1